MSEANPVAESVSPDVEALVGEHARLVYRIAYSVLRNHHDAEDAAQETFLRVVRHQRRLAAVRDPRAWLARIAWRVALSRRSAAPEVSFEQAAEAVFRLRAAGAGTEEIAGDRQLVALLERLIASLPRKLREALILSTVEEMASAEVAAVLGIPEASVRTRVSRARQLLRAKLSAILEGEHGR